MCMCENMVVAIFKVSAAFGTIPEFQLWIVLRGTPTDGTAVYHVHRTFYFFMVFPAPLSLRTAWPLHPTCDKKEDEKVRHRHCHKDW